MPDTSHIASGSVHIRLMPSRALFAALAAVHLGGVVCVLASDLPWLLQWALTVAVVGHAVRSIALHATGRAARAIVHLKRSADGAWRLTQRDGTVVDAVLDHGSYSHPALVALVLRDSGGRAHRLLVVPDRTDLQDFRRLRVCLRCQGAQLEADERGTPLC